MAYLLGYTREPIDNVHYDPRLAYSLHLALSEDGITYQGLNHNSGVLFAKATENEDGSLNPMSLADPRIFAREDGTFGVVAQRILGDGGSDDSSQGKVLVWTTKDFLVYEELGLYDPAEVPMITETADPKTLELKEMQGAILCNSIRIPEATADRLRKKLLTPVNVGVRVPEQKKAKCPGCIRSVKAEVLYSDGTVVERPVDWQYEKIDFTRPGAYEITGQVRQKHFAFPVALHRADPDVCYWQGKYYFISTNDEDNNHTLYARVSDTLEGLVDAEDHLILDSDTYEDIGNLLWAPEFHEINGRLYIFHAATPDPFFHEESHIMCLKEGGDPVCKEDWSRPVRIVRKDGSDLCEAGRVITLDMTCFLWEGEYYVSWSQREFKPKDLGAWLYIAKLDPEKPWMLASAPVVLSKPDYGWGNNHTFVEEGPFALPVENKLYLTFSAAAVDTSYVVSYLEAEHGKDILDPANWRKNNYPILTSRSVEGEFGTGHNAYVVDEDGLIWNTYHARPGEEGVRSSGIRRVHLDIDGAPMLDVTEEKDLKDEYRTVKMTVIIE
ncbi:MAG: family 43 glycosylhydrolase [Acetatifactor sp.]|nr:family 43 glycosylhydrolase [Acetatifactor sp.]